MFKRLKVLLGLLVVPLLLAGCLGTGPEGTPTVTVIDGRTIVSTQIDHVNNSTMTMAGVNPSYRAGDTISVTMGFANNNIGPMDTKYQVRLLNKDAASPLVYTQTALTLLQIGPSQRQTQTVTLIIPGDVPQGDYRVNLYFDYFGKENKPIANNATFDLPTSVTAR